MLLNQQYAKFLMSITNAYACQQSVHCEQPESWFEEKILELFEEASGRGIKRQDIAVIATTAIAVVLTKPKIYEAADPKPKPHRSKLAKLAWKDPCGSTNETELVLVQEKKKNGRRRPDA
jgi:hypothetical protein